MLRTTIWSKVLGWTDYNSFEGKIGTVVLLSNEIKSTDQQGKLLLTLYNTQTESCTEFLAAAAAPGLPCLPCRIPTTLPATLTVGGHQPLNNFGDLLREEISRAGYTEMLTHGLCSREENFKVS